MNEKKKLQPKVRFREFTGENAPDWEQRKLGEVATLINGRAYKQNELLDQGKYRVLRVGNFNTNDRWYWSNLELEDNKYANKGELLYLWATNFGPKIWEEEKVIYHYHIWKVDYLSGSLEKKYLYTWLLVDKDKITKDTNGSTMIHITKKNMEERKISIPVFEEQKCIGQFFEKVDKLITLHQRKLEQLEQLKNTLLSKMFPKSGTNIPEIRFSGFTDTWKQRQLGELTQINTGSGDLQDSVIDGKYPFFVRSEKIERSNRYIFDGEAILIPGEGKLGEIYHYIDGKFDYHQRVYKISNFSDSNTFGKFILFELNKNFKKHALKYTVKATVDSLRLPTLKKYQILVPSYYEQVKIGEYFFSINNYIAIHQRKLEQLKNLKQTLLNKMFI